MKKEKLYYIDITDKWLESQSKFKNNIKIYKKGETYVYRGEKYKVDGHFIKYTFDEKEKEFAEWLAKCTKKKIILMPKIEKPQKIKTPDFRINNIYYDLKTIHGNSNQILYHRIRGMKKQAECFIFESTKSSLTVEELTHQANKIFKSTNPDRNWVKIIAIKKENNLIVLKKKR